MGEDWLSAAEDYVFLLATVAAIACVVIALWPIKQPRPALVVRLENAHWRTTNSNWLGRMGELLICSLMASEGWLQVHSKYSADNGIDAIFLKPLNGESWNALYERGAVGTAVSVRILEIKANTSPYEPDQISRAGIGHGLHDLVIDPAVSEEMKGFYENLKRELEAIGEHVQREFCHIDLQTGIARFWHIREDRVADLKRLSPYQTRTFEHTWVQSIYFATRPNGETTRMSAEALPTMALPETVARAA